MKSAIPTSEELINRAEALLPRLRERAAQAEENRRLSDETVQEFRAAGFHKILQPKRYGGFESTGTFRSVRLNTGNGVGTTAWGAWDRDALPTPRL